MKNYLKTLFYLNLISFFIVHKERYCFYENVGATSLTNLSEIMIQGQAVDAPPCKNPAKLS